MPRIGELDSQLRPVIRLTLRGNQGREQTLEARLDTGFDLSLAMPKAIARALDLTYVKTRTMYLANGETYYFAEYSGRGM